VNKPPPLSGERRSLSFLSPRSSSERKSLLGEARGPLAGRHDADLGKDTPQLALARHPCHVESTSKLLQASAHQQRVPKKV